MEWSMRGDHTRLVIEEHWRAILQHSANIVSESELKYEYMAFYGGAVAWLFLPCIPCGQGQVIDCHKLQGLEQKIIGLYLNALNRM